MLSNFEKRSFKNGENIWIGKYKNLKNILHWHFEYEIISVLRGNVHVKIGGFEFSAEKGDIFVCFPNELHYMNGDDESLVEIIIFPHEIPKELSPFKPLSPKISKTEIMNYYTQIIKDEFYSKNEFYKQKITLLFSQMLIDILRSEKTIKKSNKENDLYKKLITKINDNFNDISFIDAANFSGYSPTYFSRMFKRLSNMTFSEYLNYIKVEKAIPLIKEKKMSITEISSACGFSTIRNFNRVFKMITGYSPSTISKDYILNIPIENQHFNPTATISRLLD